jgi:mRNA interferase RelE/StbE
MYSLKLHDKVYIDKKRVRIVFEVQDDILTIYTIAIGQRYGSI